MTGAKLSRLAIKHIEVKHCGYVVNTIVASKSGTADLIACIDGKFFAFEIKGDSDTEKPLQDAVLNRVANANGYGGYVYCIKDIDTIVQKLTRPYKQIRKKVIKL